MLRPMIKPNEVDSLLPIEVGDLIGDDVGVASTYDTTVISLDDIYANAILDCPCRTS